MITTWSKRVRCPFCEEDIFMEFEGDTEKDEATVRTNVDDHWICIALGVVVLQVLTEEESHAGNGNIPSPSG
jgi:hypothetical protein